MKKPSRVAQHLIKKFSVYVDRFSILEDFDEEFEIISNQDGNLKAHFWYWGQTFHAFRFYFGLLLRWRLAMLKNYFKIAFRNIIKHRGYSFLNISGLALGIACSMLILMWVTDELSYDKFHKHPEDIYRVNVEMPDSGREWPVTSIPMATAMKKDFPEIINSVRFRDFSSAIEQGSRQFSCVGAFTDPSFLNIFNFPLIKGKKDTPLNELYSILITEELAKKFFGEENPIGKTIKLDGKENHMVTGLIKNPPHNTHFRFDFLIPFQHFINKDRDPGNWGRFQIVTYLRLEKNTKALQLENKLKGYIQKHKPESKRSILKLQPIPEVHFQAFGGENYIKYIYFFSIIAIFVILIACINFMNLSTARSTTRGKEVGLRKVAGAHRSDLIKQFIGESVLLSFLALALALVLVSIFLPLFNYLTDKHFTVGILSNVSFILKSLGMVTLMGLVAGSYPALFLSSFQPMNVLRGTFLSSKRGRIKPVLFRKMLVIFQFSISIFLIISSIIVGRQVNFIKTLNIGLDKEQIIYVAMKGKVPRAYESLKNEFLLHPDIQHVTATSELPIFISKRNYGFDWENRLEGEDISFGIAAVDYDYFKTFGMKIKNGRGFSKQFSTDAKNSFIINQTAADAMKMESPVGKKFSFSTRKGFLHGRIIGVVKDFFFNTLHSEMEPLVLRINPEDLYFLCVRTKPDLKDLKGVLFFLEQKWKKYASDYPFEYSFLDDSFTRLYRSEERTGKIFLYFTFIAIFISCIGLFGLASFRVEQSRKEMGVRKVFGAPVHLIILLLSKEFTKWILMANIIAWPIAYLLMDKWLANFAYKDGMDLSSFILAVLLALGIAFLTIGYQSIRAALANPVDILKYE